MAFKKTKVALVLIVISIILVVVFSVYKNKGSIKQYLPSYVVVPSPTPAPVSAPEAVKLSDTVTEVVPDLSENALFIVPSTSIGISTRDGRNKNIDIRGTPPVTIHSDAPLWNLSPNRLPIRSTTFDV